MIRLQFHEGGQPINLDDLQALQENSLTLFKALTDTLSGQTPVFLLKKPELSAKILTKDKAAYVVSAGSMIVDGDILSWPETDLQVNVGNRPVYACVRDVESDPRVFADGQTKHCRVGNNVYLSLTKEGVSKAYNIFDLPVFADLLGKVLGIGKQDKEWTKLDILEFGNGYSGEIHYKEIDGSYFFNVDLTSNNDAWTRTDTKSPLYIGDIDATPVLTGDLPSEMSIPLNIKGQGLSAYLSLTREYHLILTISGTTEDFSPKALPLLAKDKRALI